MDVASRIRERARPLHANARVYLVPAIVVSAGFPDHMLTCADGFGMWIIHLSGLGIGSKPSRA